ncbi:hypothetical protein G6F50_014752 [Rhizopus delemar]|uniref:Uncharacterized protein n=1 Tax=Rhizopus delemar TaxID=936053 RepID=A0A9P7C6Y4_9FUNG|nr:hypothetical protein G6F50_014752 [Rhizopus delemar]
MASFMQVLDTTIANVSLPTIAGNLGASSQQATWVITSFAPPLRRTQAVRLGPAGLRHHLAAVRPGAEHGHAGGIARAAGLRGRPDVPDHAVAAGLDLSPRETRAGVGAAGHDHRGGADLRPHPRWLDHRQLQLGMDLPDQRAVGHLRRAGGGQPAEGSPGADRETEDGLRRPDHPGDRRRCATAGARPGQ